MQTLVPVHWATFSLHMIARRQPAPIHRIRIVAVLLLLHLRQAGVPPLKGVFATVAYLKVCPAAAVRFLDYRRPGIPNTCWGIKIGVDGNATGGRYYNSACLSIAMTGLARVAALTALPNTALHAASRPIAASNAFTALPPTAS